MASPYIQQPPTWGPSGSQVAAMAVPINYGVIKPQVKQLYPPGWITVPILQLIFAVISAGFAAYGLSTSRDVGLILMFCAVSCET